MNDHSSSLTVEDLLAPAVCVPPPIHPHMPLYLRCRAQLHEWETLKDTYAASVIRNGLQLDWVDGFDPDRPTDDFRPRSSHAEVTDPELVKHVLDAVQQGCMERVERKDIKCCASMFAVDKASDEAHPEGGRRPITNLKNVNEFVQTTYFRLVTLWGILPFLRHGQYACKIDLKSAYFHMGIHPRDRPYLGVYVDGEFYRWCVLPFGLNVAPREWQRLMQPILNAVRERGALVWVYLDDWLIIGNTYRECLEHTRFLVQLLHRLGILVNVPKSCLEPSQEIIMLGFMLNFREGFVAVPPKRLQAIFRDVNRLAHSHTPSVRRCASVLGRICSLLFAMPHIRLLSDALAVHVAVAVQAGWEADVALPERVSRQLMDLADELHQWKGRTFVVSMGHVGSGVGRSPSRECPSSVRLVPESRGTHKRQRVQGSPTDDSSVCAEGHHAAIFHRLNGPLLVSPQVGRSQAAVQRIDSPTVEFYTSQSHRDSTVLRAQLGESGGHLVSASLDTVGGYLPVGRVDLDPGGVQKLD